MTEGAVIDQRFRLGRVIRESSVAVVYEAKHRNGADAWIKLPRGPEHAAALTTEAQVANALGQHAVKLRDDGVTEAGLPYLVLEPVTGQRVDHWREQCGGRAPPDETMGLGDEVCQAIGAMHRGGVSVGILRPESIIVVPKGGVCLVELEHTRPASDGTVKEDVAAVGRLLYLLLSGTPFATEAPALSTFLPDLPRAMTMTVDDAARGRYSSIEELRIALSSSVPQWLGPIRRPTPSASFDMEAPVATPLPEFIELLPRSSKLLFDPALLVDSSRPSNLPGGATAGQSSGGDLWASSSQSRTSTTAYEAPPIATSEHSAARAAKAGGRPLLIAGAIGSTLLLGTVALAVGGLMLRKADREPRAPAAKQAAAAVASSAPSSVIVAPSVAVAPPTVVPPVDVPAATPSAAPAASTSASSVATRDVGSAAKAGGDTTFVFEGNLMPRLVFIDGAVIGTTTKKGLHTRCGTHSVKIGAKGIARSLDLPCGSEQALVIEQNGVWHPR